MLGDDDVDRCRAVATTDADEESVQSRLPSTTDATGSKTRLVACSRSVRSVASKSADQCVGQSSPEPTLPDGPEIQPVGNRSELQAELLDAIETFDERADGLRPAQLRVGVDSLGPILDHGEESGVRELVTEVGDSVREHNGMAHFVLTESYDSERVQRLADAFDAVVELRVTEDGGEERWHLPDRDVTMPWVPL